MYMIWDMTHSCKCARSQNVANAKATLWRDSFVYMMWSVHIYRWSETWLIHINVRVAQRLLLRMQICDVTRSYIGILCVHICAWDETWLIHMHVRAAQKLTSHRQTCDVPHSYMWRDAFIHVHDLRNDSFIYMRPLPKRCQCKGRPVTWLVRICGMMCVHICAKMRHDSYIHMCAQPRSCHRTDNPVTCLIHVASKLQLNVATLLMFAKRQRTECCIHVATSCCNSLHVTYA